MVCDVIKMNLFFFNLITSSFDIMFNGRKKIVGKPEEELLVYNIRLGIIGCRNFTDYKVFSNEINQYIKYIGIEEKDIGLIVSGGPNGADHMAEIWSVEKEKEIKVYYPNLSYVL